MSFPPTTIDEQECRRANGLPPPKDPPLGMADDDPRVRLGEAMQEIEIVARALDNDRHQESGMLHRIAVRMSRALDDLEGWTEK